MNKRYLVELYKKSNKQEQRKIMYDACNSCKIHSCSHCILLSTKEKIKEEVQND